MWCFRMSEGVYVIQRTRQSPSPAPTVVCEEACCDEKMDIHLQHGIELAVKLAKLHYRLWKTQRPTEYPWSWHEWFRSSGEEVSWQSADKPSGMMAEDTPWSRISSLPLCLSAVMYGGVHLTTFRYHFPTLAEEILWMSASIIIIVSGLYSIYHISRGDPRTKTHQFLARHGTARQLLAGDIERLRYNNQRSGPLPQRWRPQHPKVILLWTLVLIPRVFVLLESLISLRLMQGYVYNSTMVDGILHKFS